MTMIGKDFPVRANVFCLNSEKRASSPQMSPAGTLCFDIFSPAPGDSEVISQIERLSSNETKIAPRSLRMALGASGRSALTCMAVSRVGVRNLTLPERRSLSTSPWDLEAVVGLLEERIGAERRCPHCAAEGAVIRGQANGLRRYFCRGCGKTFNCLTGTPLARLRHKERWSEFGAGVVKLRGIVEADETFVLASRKGERN